MGCEPMGYINTINGLGKKVIMPNEPLATLIRKVFENVEENLSIQLLYSRRIEKGLHYSLNGFWNMICNPVYCGMIKIPAMDGRELMK